MPDRYAPGDEARPAAARDIYVAMAFAKDRFHEVPPVSTLYALRLDHIEVDRNVQASIRPTRSGIVTEVEIGGEPVRILGVQLKSSCHGHSLNPVFDASRGDQTPYDSRFDCRNLLAQQHILENWIELKAAFGIQTIVLGDFNRRLNRLDESGLESDHFWLALNDGTPNALMLEKGPEGLDHVCWPNHPRRHEEHIDFILYDAALANDVFLGAPVKRSMRLFEDDPRYAGRDQQRLSDHCPVVMEIG